MDEKEALVEAEVPAEDMRHFHQVIISCVNNNFLCNVLKVGALAYYLLDKVTVY